MIEAQTMKGIYDRGQPLMQLGLVIATSLSLSIVPMVTVMKNKQKDIEEYCRLSFQISLGVSSAATVGLLLIMSPVNTMLFQTDAGSHVLRVLSIAILFASLCTTIIAILQGLDIIFYPAFIVLFGWLMKTIFNQLCIQQWGVYGAALATICSLAIMLLLLVRKLHKTMNIPLVSGRFIKGLGLSLVTMTVILVILSQAFEYFFPFTAGDRLVSSILSILLTIIGCVVFAGMIVYSDALSNEELALMPFGNKLKSFRRGRK